MKKKLSEGRESKRQALLRKSQWRWDYAIASHGATFHAPQEVIRLLSHSVDYAQQARLLIARVAAKHGHMGEIPVPDYSTKAKAQAAIGLDISAGSRPLECSTAELLVAPILANSVDDSSVKLS